MTALKHVLIPGPLHRELKIAAAFAGEELTDITTRGVAAEVRRVMKRHSGQLQSEDRSGSVAGPKLSHPSVVSAADGSTSASLGGPDAGLSASVRESGKPAQP